MLRGRTQPVRRSRRSNPFSDGIVPPRAKKVRDAHYPSNDPWLQKMVDDGELTTEEIEAIGEIRSRDAMFAKRTKTHHQRSQNIEKERMAASHKEKVSRETPKGMRRSAYLGGVATSAERFEKSLADVESPKASDDPILITDDESIQAVLDELNGEPMAETEVTIKKLEPEPAKVAKAKNGPLSALRGEWSDDPNEGAIEEPISQEEASVALLDDDSEADHQEEVAEVKERGWSPDQTKLELLAYGRRNGLGLTVTMRNNKAAIIAAIENAEG